MRGLNLLSASLPPLLLLLSHGAVPAAADVCVWMGICGHIENNTGRTLLYTTSFDSTSPYRAKDFPLAMPPIEKDPNDPRPPQLPEPKRKPPPPEPPVLKLWHKYHPKKKPPPPPASKEKDPYVHIGGNHDPLLPPRWCPVWNWDARPRIVACQPRVLVRGGRAGGDRPVQDVSGFTFTDTPYDVEIMGDIIHVRAGAWTRVRDPVTAYCSEKEGKIMCKMTIF